MEEKQEEYWNSVEQLLDEANRIVFIEVEFNKKKIRLAWKEITEATELDIGDIPKPFDNMTPSEQLKFNSAVLTAEALARIKAAGEQEGCFNKNVITKDIWEKLPQRVRVQILDKMFQLTQAREQRF
jgi:hypothetical protein